MDVGEVLLAVTGVSAALAPGPLPVTVKTLGKADPAAYGRAIRRRLRRFLAAKGPWPKFGELPPFDYDLVLEQLPRVTPQRLEENVLRFTDEALAESYVASLGRAVGYLQHHFPIAQRPFATGAKNVTPSDLKIAPFRRRYWICDDPLRALDSLVTGLLVPDEVEALSTCFPTIYAQMMFDVLDLTVARKTEYPTWELPYERERKLQVLMGGKGTGDAAARAAVKAAFERARGAAKQAETPSGAMQPQKPTRAQELADK